MNFSLNIVRPKSLLVLIVACSLSLIFASAPVVADYEPPSEEYALPKDPSPSRSPSKYQPTRPLTAEERLMREEAEIFNDTVYGSIVTNAGPPIAVSAVIAGIQGATSGDWQNALIGFIANSITALASATLEGYRVASQQEAERRNIREIKLQAIRLEDENARLEKSIAVTSKVLTESKASLAEMTDKYKKRDASLSDLQAEIEHSKANLEATDRMIEGVEQRRANWKEVSADMKQQRNDTAELDRQIAEYDKQLKELKKERDILADEIAAVPTIAG